MTSTLGVLDVLSRLREESERASTALAAQEDTNRSLLQRCTEAEQESGRTGAASEALRRQKNDYMPMEWLLRAPPPTRSRVPQTELEEGRRLAETKRREAESRLRRLQNQQTKREDEAAQKRDAAMAAADASILSSKKFRSDAAARVRQIGELRARLQEKIRELERIQKQATEVGDEIATKSASRDKLKAEIHSRNEAVGAALAKTEEVERDNKAVLARARRVEGEIDEVRETQEEMQGIAAGLQKKNAVLRNELRNLKRGIGIGHPTSTGCSPTARGYVGPSPSRGVAALDLRSSREYRRSVTTSQSREEADEQSEIKGRYYHHIAAPQETERREAALPEASPYRQPVQRTTRNASVRAPFSTAAAAMSMPELRLSSPHPGGRSGNETSSSSFRRRGRVSGSNAPRKAGGKDSGPTPGGDTTHHTKDEEGMFEYYV